MSTSKIEKPLNILAFPHMNPLGKYFTKEYFMYFAVHICCYNIVYISNTAYERRFFMILFVIPILNGISNVITSIHVPQKCQYHPNLVPVSKDQHPKSGTSLQHQYKCTLYMVTYLCHTAFRLCSRMNSFNYGW